VTEAVKAATSTHHPAEKWQQVDKRASRALKRGGAAALLTDTAIGGMRGFYEFFEGVDEVQVWRWKEKQTNCVGWYMTKITPQGEVRAEAREALITLRSWFGIQ
jgi:hypothetical protein